MRPSSFQRLAHALRCAPQSASRATSGALLLGAVVAVTVDFHERPIAMAHEDVLPASVSRAEKPLALDDVDHANYLAKQNTARKRRDHYRFVIIGAGTTAHAAIQAILKQEPHADILLLTDEAALPRLDVYQKERPLPSDLLESYNEWRRHVSSKLEAEPHAFSSVPITLVLGSKRLRLDSDRRALILDDGSEVLFDHCLLATAGRPRPLYVLAAEKSAYFLRDRINTLSSWADFDVLQHVGDSLGCRHVAVVGGGFLGTEIALALARRGMRVSQVYAEAAPLLRHIPIYLAEYVQERLRRHGVTPVSERLVTDIRFGVGYDGSIGGGSAEDEDNGLQKIHLTVMGWAKDRLTSDYVVLASTHVDPEIAVARESGLEIDSNNGGIVVNGQLEAVGGIYAAGACASYYDARLGRRRVDMLDHSVSSGTLAGYNMSASTSRNPLVSVTEDAASEHKLAESPHAGGSSAVAAGMRAPHKSEQPLAQSAAAESGSNAGTSAHEKPVAPYPRTYLHQPIFRSHLEELGIIIEGLGELDSSLRTVGVWVTAQPGASNDDESVPPAAPIGAVDDDSALRPVGMPSGAREGFSRGVVYYLRGAQIAGIMLWNAKDLCGKARDVLRTQPTFNSTDELKKLVALAPDDWLRIVETSSTTGDDLNTSY